MCGIARGCVFVDALATRVANGHENEGFNETGVRERARCGVDAPLHTKRRHRIFVEHVLAIVQIHHRITSRTFAIVTRRQAHDHIVRVRQIFRMHVSEVLE